MVCLFLAFAHWLCDVNIGLSVCGCSWTQGLALLGSDPHGLPALVALLCQPVHVKLLCVHTRCTMLCVCICVYELCACVLHVAGVLLACLDCSRVPVLLLLLLLLVLLLLLLQSCRAGDAWATAAPTHALAAGCGSNPREHTLWVAHVRDQPRCHVRRAARLGCRGAVAVGKNARAVHAHAWT